MATVMGLAAAGLDVERQVERVVARQAEEKVRRRPWLGVEAGATLGWAWQRGRDGWASGSVLGFCVGKTRICF
jgi:hypothetical protein